MTQDVSSKETWISAIQVEGLHNRLSFAVDFKQGINVIYGKNGIGKTTLLHIISNISEIDIDRFHYLSFKRISLTNSAGNSITLEKNDGAISVLVNRQKTSYVYEKIELSEAERESIRAIVGARATYLPAFRSVLERMRENSYVPHEERSKPEFEALQRAEAQALRSIGIEDRFLRRSGNVIESNVSKTLRCRQWFGDFVPVVRYPSITDVVMGLSDEWTTAQIALSRIEQKQFETAFVEIFSAIAQGDTDSHEQDQAAILNRIKELVSEDESKLQIPSVSTYSRLVSIAESNYDSDRNYNNILEIYLRKLLDRRNERELALYQINAFQESVNVFLTEKAFRVGSRVSTRPVRVRDPNVFIEPSAGSAYGVPALSSGERQIVTMLYSSSRSPFKDGCCLIDEPELSLHVDWQRIILRQIEKQHHGRQIIACTHSPEIGADHEDRVQFFAPTANVISDDETEVDEAASL